MGNRPRDPDVVELKVIKGVTQELVKLDREQLNMKRADALEFVA